MVRQEISTAELIRIKQDILKNVPKSGGAKVDKSGNKEDIVMFFNRKIPGADAELHDNGIVMRRFYWGDKKHLNQYGGYVNVLKRLKSEGYEPFLNFFSGTNSERWEQTHREAKQKTKEASSFFPTIPYVKYLKKDNRLGYDEVSLPHPTLNNSQIREFPVRQQFIPNVKAKVERSNAAGYERLFANIERIGKIYPTKQLSEPKLLNLAEYSKWAGQQFTLSMGKKINTTKKKGGNKKKAESE